MRNFLYTTSAVLLLVAGPSWAQNKGKPTSTLPAGTAFLLSPVAPKYVTCDAEFRDTNTDENTARWPNFFYGKPAAPGSFTFDPTSPKADLSIRLDKMTQPRGDQSRRVLGELCGDEKFPVVTLSIKGVGSPKTKTVTTQSNKGKTETRTVEYAEFDAVLTLDNTQLPVKAEVTLRPTSAQKDNADKANSAAQFDARCTVSGRDLGLTSANAPASVDIRVSWMGYQQLPADKKK